MWLWIFCGTRCFQRSNWVPEHTSSCSPLVWYEHTLNYPQHFGPGRPTSRAKRPKIEGRAQSARPCWCAKLSFWINFFAFFDQIFSFLGRFWSKMHKKRLFWPVLAKISKKRRFLSIFSLILAQNGPLKARAQIGPGRTSRAKLGLAGPRAQNFRKWGGHFRVCLQCASKLRFLSITIPKSRSEINKIVWFGTQF